MKYRVRRSGEVEDLGLTDLAQTHPSLARRLGEMEQEHGESETVDLANVDDGQDEWEPVEDVEELFKGELRQSYEDAMNDGADSISDEELMRRLREVDNDE